MYGESGRKWVVGSTGGVGDNFIIYDRGINGVVSAGVRLSINESDGGVSVTTLGGSGNVYV